MEFPNFLGPYFSLKFIQLISQAFKSSNVPIKEVFEGFYTHLELQKIEEEIIIRGN